MATQCPCRDNHRENTESQAFISKDGEDGRIGTTALPTAYSKLRRVVVRIPLTKRLSWSARYFHFKT